MSVEVTWNYVGVGPAYAIPRYQRALIAVQWADQFVIECGQSLLLQETLFGGYQCRIKIATWAWNWSSKTARLPQLFEDVYVLAPDHVTHVPGLTFDIDWHYNTPPVGPTVAIAIPGHTDMWTFNPLPPAPPTYWQSPWATSWPNCDTHRIP